MKLEFIKLHLTVYLRVIIVIFLGGFSLLSHAGGSITMVNNTPFNINFSQISNTTFDFSSTYNNFTVEPYKSMQVTLSFKNFHVGRGNNNTTGTLIYSITIPHYMQFLDPMSMDPNTDHNLMIAQLQYYAAEVFPGYTNNIQSKSSLNFTNAIFKRYILVSINDINTLNDGNLSTWTFSTN